MNRQKESFVLREGQAQWGHCLLPFQEASSTRGLSESSLVMRSSGSPDRIAYMGISFFGRNWVSHGHSMFRPAMPLLFLMPLFLMESWMLRHLSGLAQQSGNVTDCRMRYDILSCHQSAKVSCLMCQDVMALVFQKGSTPSDLSIKAPQDYLLPAVP